MRKELISIGKFIFHPFPRRKTVSKGTQSFEKLRKLVINDEKRFVERIQQVVDLTQLETLLYSKSQRSERFARRAFR